MKNSEKSLEQKEREVLEEFTKEAQTEVKYSKPINGKMYGWYALIISIIGFVFVAINPIFTIILGCIGLYIATIAIRNKGESVGRIAGIISILDLLIFISQISGLLNKIAGF